MSDQVLHIGHTTVVVGSVFGVFTLSVGERGRPIAARVATFDSELAASVALEILKRGLAMEGVDWSADRITPVQLGLSEHDRRIAERAWRQGHREGRNYEVELAVDGGENAYSHALDTNPHSLPKID